MSQRLTIVANVLKLTMEPVEQAQSCEYWLRITLSRDVLNPYVIIKYFAYIYLEVVDFTSISIALYGLVVMYTLIKGSLEGKRPLMKFMLIKVLVSFEASFLNDLSSTLKLFINQVALTYYQAFILSALVRQGVIKPNRKSDLPPQTTLKHLLLEYICTDSA